MNTEETRETMPRREYPRPSWRRSEWQCLNGLWDFTIGQCESNASTVSFEQKILVPFAPESKLSGIGNTDFMECVWYRRRISIPENWQNKEILLHFQAVDYDTTIWLDGMEVARHRGCFTPISAKFAPQGRSSIEVTVRARTLRDRNRPRGKQSDRRENYLACYTRTSGIWQTVWMEPVSSWHMKRPRITPTTEGFQIEVPLTANRHGGKVKITLKEQGTSRVIATVETAAFFSLTPTVSLTIPEEKRHCWGPENPYLYDLKFELHDKNGTVVDCAESYAGWRFLTIDGMCLRLNGIPLYQRLVLDQGYYPEGIWTAPDDDALIKDIELSMSAGFNGARLHQKVFEERFLYHADRIGYLVWGEIGDWGVDWDTDTAVQPPAGLYQPAVSLAGQWLEVLARDYNHPAIIGWCGLNETHRRVIGGEPTLDVIDDLTKAMFLAAKASDCTRPVLDVSGYIHRLPESDIYDNHDYGLPEEVDAHLASFTPPCCCDPNGEAPWNTPWQGQPFFLSEIGGIGWPVREGDFCYGPVPESEEDVLTRLASLLKVIHQDRRVFGYCYTQLTDIYQECNGLFTFDRKAKFSLQRLRNIQVQPTAYQAFFTSFK